MDQNFLTNFYNLTQTEVSAAVVVFNILFSFALASAIVWVWRKTHRGLSYSQSFAMTIIMISPLSCAVMMIVQNNLIGAFALLGAFSLIRFRTIMKETRDIAFLFFALTIGVSTGTGYYSVALLTTVIMSAIVLTLYRLNFAATSKTGFILTFHTKNSSHRDSIQKLFDEYFTEYELIHEKTAADGNEYAYAVHFRKEHMEDEVMQKLRSTGDVVDAYLITARDAIEY